MGVNNGEKEKEVIAKEYGTLPPHQQRVVDEKAQNDERMGKLSAFFDTSIFANLVEEEKFDMRYQYALMRELSGVLGNRIGRF
jgi:hypothetical protein